ncbi:MAG: hypothetical protein Q9164_005783 [Protoblastenia rupestris]
MIALHTALTIFKPRTLIEESGLYPYRYAAYTGWVIYPSLMASLAFIHGRDAYVVQGAFCSLPIRPFWYRLALSWVPRYAILIFILSVYVAVYFYIKFKFRNLAAQMSETQSTFSHTMTDRDRALLSAEVDGENTPSPNATLHRRHKAIRKQLRYMFVYPLVYLLMWIPPFANHCFGYSKTLPPFALNMVALACLTLQCAADCLVFNMREKPWRHMRRFGDRGPAINCTKDNEKRIKSPPTAPADEEHGPEKRSRNWWDQESAAIGTDGAAEGRVARFFRH